MSPVADTLQQQPAHNTRLQKQVSCLNKKHIDIYLNMVGAPFGEKDHNKLRIC